MRQTKAKQYAFIVQQAAEIERLRAALRDGSQRVMNLAPRDGTGDSTAYFQLSVDLMAAVAPVRTKCGE
jgi:methylphosphotriester-DNA--protein-cysteine methyltransferase